MEMESLRELYIDELKDLYSAENQIVKALPKMVKARRGLGASEQLPISGSATGWVEPPYVVEMR